MYNPLVTPVGTLPVMAGVDQSRPSGAIIDEDRAVLVVDGTPIRLVMLAGAAALSVWAFRAAGFRFNVGVSA
jgi:hypothetical protein